VEGLLFHFAILMGGLGLAAAISIWARLPVVPLYIAAGALLGRLLEPTETVEFLGSLGVVFLLFSMGLEFSTTSLRKGGPRFLRAGAIDWALNFPTGLILGRLLGWSWEASLFLAGILYMSSSAVVSKCIADFGRAARPETETILGVMVFEDLVIAAYLVLMSTLVTGTAEPGIASYGLAIVKAGGFVGLLVLLASRFQAPLARLIASRSEEGFTLALFAFVLLVASAGIAAGLSEAVGAFLAGLVIGSTNLKQRAAETLRPYQMLFAALFFVSFGMSVDLDSIPAVAGVGALLIVIGFAAKVVGGFLAGRSAGHNGSQSLVVGLSLVPKGEFSILIAAMAAGVASPEPHIQALTGLYVFVLSILGPIGMREADRIRALLFRGAGGSGRPRANAPLAGGKRVDRQRVDLRP